MLPDVTHHISKISIRTAVDTPPVLVFGLNRLQTTRLGRVTGLSVKRAPTAKRSETIRKAGTQRKAIVVRTWGTLVEEGTSGNIRHVIYEEGISIDRPRGHRETVEGELSSPTRTQKTSNPQSQILPEFQTEFPRRSQP